MAPSGRSDIDRLAERLANAEGFLTTARRDAQRLDDEKLWGQVDLALGQVRAASRTLIDLERSLDGAAG